MNTDSQAHLGQGSDDLAVSRRRFLQKAGAATALASGLLSVGSLSVSSALAAPAKGQTSESLVKVLYDSLTADQKKDVCFAWDHKDPKLGLLRSRISANWHITDTTIAGDFFTRDQRHLIRDIFEGLIQPDWLSRIDRQLKDDNGGFGNESVAIFGTPGTDKFEFVLTGRHITVRCDGHSAEHMAFGGPIFYGHAASGFQEKPGHPGNVFWPQALAANSVYHALDNKQQAEALIKRAPSESAVGFQGKKGHFPGISIRELSADQKQHVQSVLEKLIEPYRQSDRNRAVACLKAQGGLDDCHLAFYEEGALEKKKAWDNWRLEGPAFVWHFRGTPHVHTWVHVADDPNVKLNA